MLRSYHSQCDVQFLPCPTPYACSDMFHQTMWDIQNSRIWVHVCYFDLPTIVYGFWGLLIYLSNGILHAQKLSKITVAKEKRNTCSCLATVGQSGQKNRNGETIAVFFALFSTTLNKIVSVLYNNYQLPYWLGPIINLVIRNHSIR